MADMNVIQDVKNKLAQKLDKTIDVLQSEYDGVRAGRANPHILDRCV